MTYPLEKIVKSNKNNYENKEKGDNLPEKIMPTSDFNLTSILRNEGKEPQKEVLMKGERDIDLRFEMNFSEREKIAIKNLDI